MSVGARLSGNVSADVQGVCTDVTVEREKSILKQGSIQHLYGRLSGKLREGVNDASLLVSRVLLKSKFAAGLDVKLTILSHVHVGLTPTHVECVNCRYI